MLCEIVAFVAGITVWRTDSRRAVYPFIVAVTLSLIIRILTDIFILPGVNRVTMGGWCSSVITYALCDLAMLVQAHKIHGYLSECKQIL